MTRKNGCRRRGVAAGLQSDTLVCLRERGRTAIAGGNLEAAEVAYRRAVDLGLEDPDVFNNLATIYERWGVKPEEEATLLRKASVLAPGNLDIQRNRLSLIRRRYGQLTKEGRLVEALSLAREWAEVEPDLAAAHRAVGWCCSKCGAMEEALVHITRAINLDPNNASYYNDLGLVCYELRLLAEAQGAFQEVLRLCPNSPVAYLHLGLLANLTGLTGLAINFLKRALAVAPDRGEVHNNIALFYRDQGEQKACRHHYEEAVRLRPGDATTFSNYLLSLNDDPDAEPAWVASEHRRFEKLIQGPRRIIRPSDLSPTRKLRVGYLSSDFRVHSVAYFITSVLACHDREQVETFAYYTGYLEDGMTGRIRKSVDCFRTVYRQSDDDLGAAIIGDQIDILVDLSGHTGDNRMAMLARRVAPVQISYLGYPNTTGLSQMDCRITDALADPPGPSDEWYTEQLVRMDGGFLAYEPFEGARALQVSELPAAAANHTTFGSFNNLGKINDGVLDAWAEILARVPGSVLLLKARGLGTEMVKQRITAAFAARGVDAEGRVQLMGHERSALDHLRMYNLVDIALDTFPYNGTTTTCEALWMGTPVITFEGDRHAARVGTSILTHAGLSNLVAKDRHDYVELAVALGSDLDRLTAMRRGLREKLAASGVMAPLRLARGLEKGYREAWQRYCAAEVG
jgi:protein O-GlcNAc transferase